MKYFYKSIIALTILIVGTTSQLFSQNNNPEIVGDASSFIEKLRLVNQSGLRKKTPLTKLDKNGTLKSALKSFRNDSNHEIYSGQVEGEKNSNVFLEVTNNKVTGKITLADRKKSFNYSTNSKGEIVLEETDINKVICVDYGQNNKPKSKRSAHSTSALTFDVYKLHSNVNAPTTIYLDFDGEFVISPHWLGLSQINALPSGMTPEDIYVAWSIVAEDFSPFNVDVTTDRAYYDSKPDGFKHMNIITPTDIVEPGKGGIAGVGSFTSSSFYPSWTFRLTGEGAGEAASHEIGHAFGLFHDGVTEPYDEYYGGHGNWATIMGDVDYYKEFTQWSKGEYLNANNKQDDIYVISMYSNKTGYKPDDYGNTRGNASPMKYQTMAGTSGVVYMGGVITKNTDVDVLRFTTNGGSIALQVKGAAPVNGYPVANLDIKAEILSANGTVLSTSNLSGSEASVSMSLVAGTYYLRIDGVGAGSPPSSGYTDYGSIGTYTISGTINAPVTNEFTARIVSPEEGAEFVESGNVRITPNLTITSASTLVEYFLNGTKVGQTSGAANHYLDLNLTADGNYSVYIKASNPGYTTFTTDAINFSVYKAQYPETTTANKKPHLIYEYYEGTFNALPNFSSLTSLNRGLIYKPTLDDLPARADNFAIRYTGYIKLPEPGFFRFCLSSDDGSKMYLNNKLIINNDGNHIMRDVSGKALLYSGYHPITIEYYDATSAQGIDLKVFNANNNKEIPVEFYHNDIVPQMMITKENKLVPGVKYEYNEGTYDLLPNFNSLSYKSIGGLSDFNLSIPGRKTDYFAVRYTGYLEIPFTGEYKFFTSSDDGTKLYIDGTLVVTNDGTHGMIEKNGSVWLYPGKHDIKVEYFEKNGGEGLTVSYSGPGVYFQSIPTTALGRDNFIGEQISYKNIPNIPGELDAENYDQGGEGYAYHDNTAGNQLVKYRNDNVDIREVINRTVGYGIDNIEDGEWVEYTVNATKNCNVNVLFNCSSGNGTSKLHLEKTNLISPAVNIPVISNGSTSQTVTIPNISFTQGEQIIKIYFEKGGFMLDKVTFQEVPATREPSADLLAGIASDQFSAPFPNPFEGQINIDASNYDNIQRIRILSLNGSIISETKVNNGNEDILSINLDVPSGMYILEIKDDNKVTHSSIIRK